MKRLRAFWAYLNGLIPRAWRQSPPLTWAFHALMVVGGVVPLPIGAVGIIWWQYTGHTWLWITGSGITLIWYWVREYRQNGLKPKAKWFTATQEDPPVGTQEVVFERSFIQRYDPWFDVLVPTFGSGLQLGLLGWLW